MPGSCHFFMGRGFLYWNFGVLLSTTCSDPWHFPLQIQSHGIHCIRNQHWEALIPVYVDLVYSVKSDNSNLHLKQSRRFFSIFISVESWLHQFKEHIYLKNNINVFNYKSIISLIIIIIIICSPMQSNMGTLLFVLVYVYHKHYYPVFNEKNTDECYMFEHTIAHCE